MRKYLNIVLLLILCLVIYGCEKTKVTFNYNCPSVSNYECNVSNKKLNCTFTMPECNGKEFIGWYDNPTNGSRINLDKDFEENTTLYAHWIDKSVNPTPVDPTPEPTENTTYRIVFNANGGSGGQTSSIEVKYEETLPQISEEKPIKEGYIFTGWYDNSDYTRGEVYYDEKCEATKYYDKKENIILYAGWKENPKPVDPTPEPTPEVVKYKITFNLNGGSGTLPKDISIEYSETLPSINTSAPTRTGYEFTGWYDNSDYTKGNKYYSTDGKSVRNFNRKSDMTLYAGWKIKTYTITFNSNNGSGGQSGSLSATYNGELPTISKSIPTRSEYTFTGWYDNSDYTKGKEYYNSRCEAVRNYDKTNNITLYAGWSKVVIVQTYEVTFNINGGVGNVPRTVNAVLGSAMPSITTNVPSRSGYTFMGWYDNSDYTKGTQYYTNKNVSARSYDKTTKTTLYAGWKSILTDYVIKYNCNGGSGTAPADQKVKVGKSYTLNNNTCTKTYRKFAGWVDPTNKVWKNKQSGTWNYQNGDNGIKDGVLVLKAKWEIPLSANDTARKPTSKYAGECSSKTSGGVYNKMPFLKVGEYCSFESPTLKYYIEQTTKHHRTTYIWVQDAYNQMRVAMTETNADGTHKTQKSEAIMKHEISSKGYSNKGLVGVNASAMIPYGDSNPPKTWNGQPRINLFINEGKVIRYDPNTFWFHQRHYGLAEDGILKDYYMGLTKDLTKAEKVKKAILNDKVKYTFGWFKPLIKDGKSGYNASSPGDWDSTNMLMSLCQIDLNNFVIFSSATAARTKEQGAISYHQELDLLLGLGCKYAYGLDSGGSTSFFYKSRSTKLYGPGNLYDNRNIADIVYFVEK